MAKYIVSIRKSVEDWETPSDEWSDEHDSEPFLEVECSEDAEWVARRFLLNCGDRVRIIKYARCPIG